MKETGKSTGKTAAEERKERQAAALRANLRRRKDQARGRRDDEVPGSPKPKDRD